MTWKEIADRKREDRERVSADQSRLDESRARLDAELPAYVDAIVKAITAQIDEYHNQHVPVEAHRITTTYDRVAMTAQFQKLIAPAATLTIKVSRPASDRHGRYEATVECETIGRAGDQELSTDGGRYAISMRDLGIRYQQIGRDGAYSDMSFDRLIDAIIKPLVYFVT